MLLPVFATRNAAPPAMYYVLQGTWHEDNILHSVRLHCQPETELVVYIMFMKGDLTQR